MDDLVDRPAATGAGRARRIQRTEVAAGRFHHMKL
ncbi:hypothetical protein IL54_0452 [Sphingobium sp. ba1]|nr:hypothetical protein IL54_0452 [Sphingobium sp. ba1]